MMMMMKCEDFQKSQEGRKTARRHLTCRVRNKRRSSADVSVIYRLLVRYRSHASLIKSAMPEPVYLIYLVHSK